MIPRYFKETPVSVFKQGSTINTLLIYYFNFFNFNNLFKDFNINIININNIAECCLPDKAIIIIKFKNVKLKSKKKKL